MSNEPQFVLCPYCGHMQKASERCEECKGLFEPLSRKATQISMGPWYIRDKSKPFRPGCSYEVLKRQAQTGRLKPMTILRGPTTRQFWSLARNTPGVAHLLGYCHQCGTHVPPDSKRCPKCEAAFVEPGQRNELGLQFATHDAVATAQRELDHQVAVATGAALPSVTPPSPGGSSHARSTPPPVPVAPKPTVDLLDQVLGSGGPPRPAGSRSSAQVAGSALPAKSPAGPTIGLPPIPPVAAPQAISFDPSEDDDEEALTAEQQMVHDQRRKQRIFIGVLILSNVLVLLVVGIFAWMAMNAARSTTDAGNTPTGTQQTELDGGSNTTGRPQPGITDPMDR